MIDNEMILASAGSGKTYQLTNRYIAIMAQQLLAGEPVTPERIVAVTFTRKAAGEFFDSILKKLAEAARSEADAARLCPPESDPLYPIYSQLGVDEYRKLLRVFIRQMPRLFLGTLDSFFAAILRSFPAEFGLAGDFDILDEHQALSAREQTFRDVFQRDANDRESEKAFIEAFRLATFGKEEASIRRLLDTFVDDHHEVYLHAATEAKWGQKKAIWPQGTEWFDEMQTDLRARFDELLECFTREEVKEKQLDFWEAFRDEALEHVPGNPLPKRVEYFLKALLPVLDEIQNGEPVVTVNRGKQTLSSRACAALYPIVVRLVGAELLNRLQRTQGIFRVVSLYELAYSAKVRRRGRLTFQDLELILAGHEAGGAADAPGPVLSQRAGEDDRLQIDYRLDARYDHWLLDEFQDTNFLQWSVIANLVDETVQDTSERRSLFQVGDVKQAIYAWRGGDTRLFRDISDHYNQGDVERIKPRALNISWRSGHDVIDTVNEVFGTPPALNALSLPEATLQRWEWEPHTVAPPNEKLPGYCAWYHPPAAETKDDEDRYAIVVDLLEEIQPVKRGLSCAILVQSNRVGRALVDFIRAHSPSKIPVLSESDVSVACDNPVTLLMLSLFQYAAHPGDRWAYEHLKMSPLEAVFTQRQLEPARIAITVLQQVYEHGFEHTARHWFEALRETTEFAPFSERRIESLTLAARIFDQGGSRDIDDFLNYARRYTAREPDTRSAVQVMTIHKSKGLTFDCVLLPDLEGQSLKTIRQQIGVSRNRAREVEWVYETPGRLITDADQVLKTYIDSCEAEAAYEQLCKFYVAMTRARQAVYLVTSPVNPKSRSENFLKLLGHTLGHDTEPEPTQLPGNGTGRPRSVQIRYETDLSTTRRDWYEEKPFREEVAPEVAAPTPPTVATARQRPRRRTPSGTDSHATPARQVFARDSQAARDYGTRVHAYFERIEWIEAGAPPLPDDDTTVAEEIRAALDTPEIRTALSRPSPTAECWRERRFEILLEGEWLSGTFDRVVLDRDTGKATIQDFKTNREVKPEIYRGQLDTYREVLSKMTGLPTTAIRCQLIYTKARQVVDL